MTFTTFLGISIVVYLGLAVGTMLSSMAKDELKDGKKYFILLHHIVLAFILFFVLELYNLNAFIILLLPLVLILALFYYKDSYKKSYLVYPVLGVAFALSFAQQTMFLIIATLIFFYGFLISSLHKNYIKILTRNLLFFVCLIVFLIV